MIPSTIPYKLIAGALVSLAVVVTFFIQQGEIRHWKKQSAGFEQLYRGEQMAHQLTVANYRAQAEAARKADADHKAKVETDQKAVSTQRISSYETRITDARTSYQRLQPLAGTAPSHSGSTGTASVSLVPSTPSSPDGSTAQGELSADDSLTATEQAIQLDELIKWIGDQGKVNRQP